MYKATVLRVVMHGCETLSLTLRKNINLMH